MSATEKYICPNCGYEYEKTSETYACPKCGYDGCLDDPEITGIQDEAEQDWKSEHNC